MKRRSPEEREERTKNKERRLGFHAGVAIDGTLTTAPGRPKTAAPPRRQWRRQRRWQVARCHQQPLLLSPQSSRCRCPRPDQCRTGRLAPLQLRDPDPPTVADLSGPPGKHRIGTVPGARHGLKATHATEEPVWPKPTPKEERNRRAEEKKEEKKKEGGGRRRTKKNEEQDEERR